MNAAQLHLMLNHVPVVGTVFVMVALGAGLWLRKPDLVRFALALLVGVALAAVPVFFSGEPAEERVEHLAGVSERAIAAHEDAARTAAAALGALGLVALGGLVFARRRDVPRRFAAVLLVLTLALGGAMAWTAHLGGAIRHPEIRGGDTTAMQSAGEEDDD